MAIVGRLGYWQVLEQERLADEAFFQTTLRQETPSQRGEIFDRSGTVVLATTVDRERLAAMPSELTPKARREVAAELIRILGLTDAAATDLSDRMAGNRKYVVLAHELPPATADKIRLAMASGRIDAVMLEPEPIRVYPQTGGAPDTTLAAHLLGFVNRDGDGQYGVEQFYQPTLAGSPRVVHAQRDVASRAIPDTVVVEDPGASGEDLRLTLDASLQLAVEQEVFAAWTADRAKSVSAVVMDPNTGEIYAQATYPSYDANQYRTIAANDPNRFVDPIVSSVYEPGSVFKMLTAIAALQHGTVKPTTKLKDVGTLRLDGGKAKVDDADRRGMGWMTFEDAIAYSRNVVAAKVALALDKTTRGAASILHDTWLKLGFGRPTGIDLAGEVDGLVRDPAIQTWRQIDLANGSFGQGVAVTPIQLVTAYAAMINGGRLVQPHVVKAVGVNELSPPTRGDPIDVDLSRTLVHLMNHVVTEVPFYRNRTLIKGYDVGGKTGTAQIWDPAAQGGRGDWKENIFNYSFVGYIGRDKGVPDLVVAVRISEAQPTVVKVGRLEMPVMSFELFRRIAYDGITTPGLLPERRVVTVPTTASR
jgi:cell division protein FtsI/penicillin-binding protein 2